MKYQGIASMSELESNNERLPDRAANGLMDLTIEPIQEALRGLAIRVGFDRCPRRSGGANRSDREKTAVATPCLSPRPRLPAIARPLPFGRNSCLKGPNAMPRAKTYGNIIETTFDTPLVKLTRVVPPRARHRVLETRVFQSVLQR